MLFFDGDDDYVNDMVLSLKRQNPNAKGIVLGGTNMIQSLEDTLKCFKYDKNVFLADVDTKYLTIDTYIRLVEMLDLVLKLSQTQAIDKNYIEERYKHLGVKLYPGKRRLTFELPPAEPVNWKTLKRLYKLQIFA